MAVVTKTHPALVDGLSAIDIGQVLLDVDARRARAGARRVARRGGRPSGAQLVLAGARRVRPPALVGGGDRARARSTDVRSTAARLSGVAGGLLRTAR